jgi:hypothetical protein
MFGIDRVVREVCLTLPVNAALRRAMAHPGSGLFHVADTLTLRLDMVWWDAAANVLRVVEVDGAQHGAESAHFFFGYDGGLAHRARCRDLIKEAVIRAAGERVAMLRIPPALERPNHTNNVALLRMLHAWLSAPVQRAGEQEEGGGEGVGAPSEAVRPKRIAAKELVGAPSEAVRPKRFAARGPEGAPSEARGPTHPRRRHRRRRSSSVPPPASSPAICYGEERKQRTLYVRERKAQAAGDERETALWRARQLASDSKKIPRDDAMYPYPPRWWADARCHRGGIPSPHTASASQPRNASASQPRNASAPQPHTASASQPHTASAPQPRNASASQPRAAPPSPAKRRRREAGLE